MLLEMDHLNPLSYTGKKQASEYEKLVDITDRFSNKIKRSMLKNAVDLLILLGNLF